MQWRKSQNSQPERPNEIQFDYNCNTVYVRKNFERKKNKGINQPEFWTYMEIKIPLNDWEYWKQLMEHAKEIEETQEAAVELAGTTADNTSMITELQTAIAELGTLSAE